MAKIIPQTKNEFITRFDKLQTNLYDTLMYLYNDCYETLKPTQIESCLKQNNVDDIVETLKDLKDHFNTNYDDEDPDCASTLLEIECLLDYFDK